MKDHHHSYFFSEIEEPFTVLFENINNVWEALNRFDVFFQNQPLGKIEVDIPQGAYLKNKEQIFIGKGTVVEPGAYIIGPCYIGENCSIRQGAYIRGNVIAGSHCVIGHATEAKNTIFLKKALAGHFAYLGDCILGNGVNLGAGTKCANLRLDHKDIIVHDSDGKNRHTTGMRKLGAIIGDRSQLGCNSVTNPGTLLGQDVHCYPCVNFGGFVPSGHTVHPTSGTKITPH